MKTRKAREAEMFVVLEGIRDDAPALVLVSEIAGKEVSDSGRAFRLAMNRSKRAHDLQLVARLDNSRRVATVERAYLDGAPCHRPDRLEIAVW